MTMKLRVIVETTYEVPDDHDYLLRVYGTIDPDECAKIDAQNHFEDLLDLGDKPSVRVEVVR